MSAAKYTAEVKDRAVKIARERGLSAAAREVGCSQGAVYHWLHAANGTTAANGEGRRPNQPYAAGTRQRALALVAERGVDEAARTLGLPRRLVLKWAKKNGIIGRGRVDSQPSLNWNERRHLLLAETLRDIEQTRALLRDRLAAGDSTGANRLAFAEAILVEKVTKLADSIAAHSAPDPPATNEADLSQRLGLAQARALAIEAAEDDGDDPPAA